MHFRFYLVFVGLCICSNLLSQSVTINEVQSSNATFLDEDNDTPDWFEIENQSDTPTNLVGWSCSDDLENPIKWVFPDSEIAPNAFLQIWASGKDRKEIGIARTLIDRGDSFKYLTPNSNPPSNWITLNFDDAAWSTGASGFGYGDGDDATQVSSGTRSIYLRHEFSISDLSQIESMLFHIDYDDAFVAYLNGQEIARANVTVTNPSYNTNASTDREAQIYQGGLPEEFRVDQFEEILNNGENILTIHVLNVSGISSDLTAIPFLSARYKTTTSEGSPANPILGFKDLKLHTNFKLSSTGESLYLFDQSQTLIDSIFVPQPCAGTSYGKTVGTNQLAYFVTPTPELQNSNEFFEEILNDDVAFSVLGGPTSATTLSLSAPNNQDIWYTLDATIPNSNSSLFSSPIEINESTVVRARLFSSDKLTCNTNTETYLIGVDHDLPIVSLVSEPDNLFDEETGIYSFGDDYEPWFPFMGANFWQDWEIPMHFSLFEANGTDKYSFDGGAKIFGGYSRANEQRSFSLFARSQYGSSSIDYPVFENRTYDTYQALVLRNSGNDWTISNIRDATMTSIMEDSDLEIQANKPVAAYINTEYWGLYHIREKINEHYIASKNDVDVEEIDLLEFGGEVVHGDNTDYLNLLSFLESNSLSSDANYNVIQDQIDIDNFILYNLANIYFDNRDWPGNNVKFWKADGKKWRWLMYDTDFAFGIWNQNAFSQNTLSYALDANGPTWPNPPWSTFVFRKLNENQKFKHRFINQFADELNTRFMPQSVSFKIDQAVMKVANEISDHFIRWGKNPGDWNSVIANMKSFGIQRHPRVKGHIRDTYNLPGFHTITIQNNEAERGYVRLNSLKILFNSWSGDYFETVPIDLIAIPKEGYKFSHWEGDVNTTDQAIQIDMVSDMTVIPIFDPVEENFAKIIINEINYKASEDHDTDDWIELHNRSVDILDLSDWSIRDEQDENSFIIPEGTLISPLDYLVLTKDKLAFNNLHPEIENVIGDFNFGLSASQDEVRLFDAAGNQVGNVAYTDESPWPEEADGEGYTLELVHPDLDGEEPSNWGSIHFHGSPGITNLESTLVNDVSLIQNFVAYPNPVRDEIYFEFDLKSKTNLIIELYDSNGRKIKRIVNQARSEGNVFIQSQLPNLVSGSYYLKVYENGAATRALKLVKI